MNKVMIIGSLNIDLFIDVKTLPAVGETILGNGMEYMTGGKGANQAIAASRFGADVTMLGKVGNDPFGKQLISSLETNEIEGSKVEIVDGLASGVATVLKLPEDNSIIVNAGANASVDEAYLKQYVQLIQASDVLLMQLEVPIEAVRFALQVAKESGVKTMINPAPFDREIVELMEWIDVITPNESEFKSLMQEVHSQEDIEIEEAMLTWNSQFPHTELIVTRGDEGSSFIRDNKLVTVPAEQVTVVDTTGAGDTFNGVLATELSNQGDLYTAIQKANLAAALSVRQRGAQSGMPTKAEVMRRSKQV